MESWFSRFDDPCKSTTSSRIRARARLDSESVTTSVSSSSSASSTLNHVSLLEETHRLELQAARIRESDLSKDIFFTSRRLELAEKFKTLMRSTGECHYDVNLNTPEATTNFPHGEFDELKRNFRAVQEENFKLQAVITDVTEVNKRWQKYNNDRQMYVQRLLSTIQDQQEQMNKIAENRIFHSKEHGDESGPLKTLGDNLLVENFRLKEEVVSLHRRLENAEREHKEHVELLEFQLKAHRDDWEAERSDKQQALQDKEAADSKLRELQKELRALKLKYREEKLHRCTQCCCCGSVADPGQCNIFLPGSHVNLNHKGYAKTYRTSGNLLPRGTTVLFGDDLTIDGSDSGEVKVTEIEDRTEVKAIKETCNDHQDTALSVHSSSDTENEKSVVEHDGNNNSEMIHTKSKDNLYGFEPVGKSIIDTPYNNHLEKQKSNTEVSSDQEVSCSVVHISPSGSGSSIEPEVVQDAEGAAAASGVTIGFNSSGLASVMTFSHIPIVKSSSLPTPEENRKKVLKGDGSKVNPLVSRWSFDSNWSSFSIASPPISQHFASSADSLPGSRKLPFSTDHMFANTAAAALPSLASSAPNYKAPSWKMSYFDEGIATQTEEDVICPGCGQVFPPKFHLKFLDHFEKCQSTEEDHKRSSAALISQN